MCTRESVVLCVFACVDKQVGVAIGIGRPCCPAFENTQCGQISSHSVPRKVDPKLGFTKLPVNKAFQAVARSSDCPFKLKKKDISPWAKEYADKLMAMCRHLSPRIRKKVKWGLACVGVEAPDGGEGDADEDDGEEGDQEQAEDEDEDEEGDGDSAQGEAASASAKAAAPPPSTAKVATPAPAAPAEAATPAFKSGEFEYGYDEEPLARTRQTRALSHRISF